MEPDKPGSILQRGEVERYLTAAKMFTISGSVITFGLTASVVYGLILCPLN